MAQLSVLKKPMVEWSMNPVTGFYRDGYCRVGKEDTGNHAVAATLTSSFLAFSATRGNDLRPLGLGGGCKWCLCATRWKEAVDAALAGTLARDDVPKVNLAATSEAALRTVTMEELEAFSDGGGGGAKGGGEGL